MVTNPLRFAGSHLTLNYATGAAGYVKAALLDETGNALPGYSFDDCDALIGDEIDAAVVWKSGVNLSALTDQAIRLAFDLKDADVFSFHFSDDIANA